MTFPRFCVADLLRSTPFAMVAIEPSGRIREANAAAEHLLGYDAGQLTGVPVDLLVSPELRHGCTPDRAGFVKLPAARSMAAGRDLTVLDRYGNELPVEIGFASMTDEGDQLTIATLVDMSERPRTGAIDERIAALTRSNEELDRFAYIAAHDLRWPLRGIAQLVGFIVEDGGDDLPRGVRQDLELIHDRVGRLGAMLSGLLAYARIGREASRPELVDSTTTLRDLADLYVPSHRFRFDVGDDCPPILAPRVLVELVFRNLLMNAVKHHDRPTGTISVDWSRDRDGLHFTVTDDGPGIPPDCGEKVFELFQTVRGRDEHESGGLGLALVSKALETVDGRIELQSPNGGRGATFIATWPADHLDAPAPISAT